MDEILDRQVPNSGRFCGFCYARLARDAERCPYCETGTADLETVEAVPREALIIYRAKKRTEERWVYGGAMFGLLIAAGVFVLLVVYGTDLVGSRPIALGIAFLALIGGGYLLAQLFGVLICGQVGYRRGSRKRDELWTVFLEERGSGVSG
jgi:ribosomal protein L40E/archaellum biogenesis protein FlaJ (TadC family)